MILFTLRCPHDHRFEAWFRDGAAFEAQAAAGAIACPSCGAVDIVKAPMAPAVVRGGAPAPAATDPAASESPPPQAPPAGAARLRALLTELRRHVEATCEPVGERFPEEARRIHYGEVEARPIYGEATTEEAEALEGEGIAVARIPWPRTDS